MPKISSIISFGDVNLKLIYILIGGLGKLVAELILYFFAQKIELSKHAFIMGINAGLGMTLAFIPDLILIHRLKNRINKKEEKVLFNNFEFIEKKRNMLTKNQLKLIIIGLCCILDYTQKILTFLYSQYIINNLWVFDIIFLGTFSYLILKIKLYSHQYFSCLFMIIFGIILNGIDLGFKFEISLIYKLFLSFLIEICYNLAVVLAKYGMDTLFMTPFELSFYEGIFAVILNIIFLSISTNVSKDNAPLLIELTKSCEYHGKTYIDNFYVYWESLSVTEVFAFIIQMFSRSIFNIFGHIIAKDFTPSHVIFLLMLGELLLCFKNDFDLKYIGSLFIIAVELFLLLIFTEIIELHFWKLDYNTKKNIRIREQRLTAMDSKSDDSGIVGDNILLQEISSEEEDHRNSIDYFSSTSGSKSN